MTAVDDITVPNFHPEPVVPAFAPIDPILMWLLADQCPESVDESCADPTLSESALVDRIAALESLQNRVAALQSAAIHSFARRHVGTRIAGGAVDPEKLQRSIAGQVALACRVSPSEGGETRGRRPAAQSRPTAALLDLTRSAAAQGRLAVTPERAAEHVLAANVGVTLRQIVLAEPAPELSTDMRDAVTAAITGAPAAGRSDAGRE